MTLERENGLWFYSGWFSSLPSDHRPIHWDPPCFSCWGEGELALRKNGDSNLGLTEIDVVWRLSLSDEATALDTVWKLSSEILLWDSTEVPSYELTLLAHLVSVFCHFPPSPSGSRMVGTHLKDFLNSLILPNSYWVCGNAGFYLT